jgi:hypothetical protein
MLLLLILPMSRIASYFMQQSTMVGDIVRAFQVNRNVRIKKSRCPTTHPELSSPSHGNIEICGLDIECLGCNVSEQSWGCGGVVLV